MLVSEDAGVPAARTLARAAPNIGLNAGLSAATVMAVAAQNLSDDVVDAIVRTAPYLGLETAHEIAGPLQDLVINAARAMAVTAYQAGLPAAHTLAGAAPDVGRNAGLSAASVVAVALKDAVDQFAHSLQNVTTLAASLTNTFAEVLDKAVKVAGAAVCAYALLNSQSPWILLASTVLAVCLMRRIISPLKIASTAPCLTSDSAAPTVTSAPEVASTAPCLTSDSATPTVTSAPEVASTAPCLTFESAASTVSSASEDASTSTVYAATVSLKISWLFERLEEHLAADPAKWLQDQGIGAMDNLKNAFEDELEARGTFGVPEQEYLAWPGLDTNDQLEKLLYYARGELQPANRGPLERRVTRIADKFGELLDEPYRLGFTSFFDQQCDLLKQLLDLNENTEYKDDYPEFWEAEKVSVEYRKKAVDACLSLRWHVRDWQAVEHLLICHAKDVRVAGVVCEEFLKFVQERREFDWPGNNYKLLFPLLKTAVTFVELLPHDPDTLRAKIRAFLQPWRI